MSTPDPAALPLGKVVGENLKRRREWAGWTQHEMSQYLRRNGLNWSRAQIAAMESGAREDITASILFSLATALTVNLGYLFEGEGHVQLASDMKQSREGLRAVLAGALETELEPWNRVQVGQKATELRYEADLALAKRLGVDVQDVIEVARKLYNRHTMTQERDLRVKVLSMAADSPMDIGEQQAHRGHITRELSKEIEAALREQGDDE